MVGEVGDAFGAAMLLDVVLAGVDRPDRGTDLATHEVLIHGLARAEGDIRIALVQVEIPVTGHELHLEVGITLVEPVQ